MDSDLSSIPNYKVNVRTKNGTVFEIYYRDLVDHVLLLRKIISQPRLTEESPLLEAAIQDYCERMLLGSISKKEQQSKLPWQIEWIWHVHRLHPLHYAEDCTKRLSSGEIVDKKINRISSLDYCQTDAAPNNLHEHRSYTSTFVPSVDLTKAVIRQRDFLDKFQQHPLFSGDLDPKNSLIVPTFNIDLIWHTHMRYPRRYIHDTQILCDFVLNHDDSIEKNVLSAAYNQTTKRWKEAYKSNYGETIDRDHLRTNKFTSSCAMVMGPILILNAASEGEPTTCASCGSACEGGGGGGGSCGGGGGGSCGGGGGGSCDGGGGGGCGGGGGGDCGGGGGGDCGGGGD
ncbi:unnamed protein product [Rotaria socialis]